MTTNGARACRLIVEHVIAYLEHAFFLTVRKQREEHAAPELVLIKSTSASVSSSTSVHNPTILSRQPL